MGTVELWLGPAGCGKTGEALQVLRAELARDWRGIRYLVPTVGHKRSMEQYLLSADGRLQGFLGDPLTTFFNFAEEVAQRTAIHGQRLSELQKYLLLRQHIRTEPLRYFARASQYAGFVTALGEAIDELKVHMIWPGILLDAAKTATAHDASELALKLREMGTLYDRYQRRVQEDNLYDNEGIMWTAAVQLSNRPDIFPELRVLVLDGFARLTPIQVEFLKQLVAHVERVIVLFDYEQTRGETYHPVADSIQMLEQAAETGGFRLTRRYFQHSAARTNALACLRGDVFRATPAACVPDASLGMLIGATPAHEAELIAREVRALLRAGTLPDGTPVTAGEIAILARDADAVRERLARTFARFGLPLQEEPPALAHTPLGRALLAALRLARDSWQREDVLALLKSGLLPIDPLIAYQVELTARVHALHNGRASWLEHWPEAETREALQAALAPLAAFDAAFRSRGDSRELLGAVKALLDAFCATALVGKAPLPDADPAGATRRSDLLAARERIDSIFAELEKLASLLGGFRREEMLEVIATALVRGQLPGRAQPREGVRLISVQSTGGEKFKVVFLCNLLQGAFPRHVRPSAFLQDHEREEELPELNIRIMSRQHLEEDEQYWFLHALSSAVNRLILSYATHDAAGSANERSYFLDAVLQLAPGLDEQAERTSFRDFAPPLERAAILDDYLARLTAGLREERAPDKKQRLAAAYTALPQQAGAFPRIAACARSRDMALNMAEIVAILQVRTQPYSATELQAYLECPFLWFGTACLQVRTIMEEFGPLDRGKIVHGALETFYRDRQQRPGQPVHLEGESLENLWPEVDVELSARLDQEPRHRNRPQFMREIEEESLRRMMRRFLQYEITRAAERGLHPAYFERWFGAGTHAPLRVSSDIPLQGKIDRIDLADADPKRAVVVDYKSSAAMSIADLKAGKVLQAPIYVLALARLLGLMPLGVEFIGLKQADAKGLYHESIQSYTTVSAQRRLADDDWQAFLADAETRIAAAVTSIRAGAIPLQPTTRQCPDRCEYFALCRGDRFALERAVREANRVEE